MWIEKRNGVVFFLIFCLFVFSVPPLYSLDPTPPSTAMDLATYEAKRRFGNQSASHFLKTFTDLQGAPAVHLFLVTKDQESILKSTGESIDKGLAIRDEGQSLILNGHIEEGQRLLARSKVLVLQENDYGTLIISAKQDGPALMAFHQGLPTYLIARTDAKERAEIFSKGEEAILVGVLYLSPLDYYFEFEVGGQKILVSPFDLEVVPRADLEGRLKLRRSPLVEDQLESSSEPTAADPYELQVDDLDASRPLDQFPNSSIVSDVPDYNQRPWLTNSCGPTAGATLLGYWDGHGYGDLLGGRGTYDDVTDLIDELCQTMSWDPSIGVYYSQIPTGFNDVINDRGYDMDINTLFGIDSLGTVKQEIVQGRPFLYGSQQNPWGQAHYVVVVGYQGNFIIVHDNWWSTPLDYFVNWDALGHYDDMITVLAPEGQLLLTSEPLPSGLGGGGGGCFISAAIQK